MRLELSENIRSLRKERGLTQEQLAEVLGVTTGAVHKWEAGLSVPELEMIVRTAEFFDISVDALLGYTIKDDSREAIIERLKAYCRTMDPEAMPEAEKALKKFPNSFEIVHDCAMVFLVFGMDKHDKAKIRRGLELLEKCLLLLPQNRDPQADEHTIYKEISAAYYMLGETDKSIELMKKHNIGGMYSSEIGAILALEKHSEDAVPFLAEGLLNSAMSMLNIISGYGAVFAMRGEYEKAEEILLWGRDMINWFKEKEGTDFIDKSRAELLVQMAQARLRTKGRDEALELLRQAKEEAESFDKAPDYGFGTIRYISETAGNANVHDIMGATAADSIKTLLKNLKDPEISTLWKEVTEK